MLKIACISLFTVLASVGASAQTAASFPSKPISFIVTSPPMRDVTLPHGAALAGPQFPVLFGG